MKTETRARKGSKTSRKGAGEVAVADPPRVRAAVLGLDPSSTRTGFGVLSVDGELLDAGYLKPRSAKAPAMERIGDMLQDLDELLDRWRPLEVAVEVPSQHVNTKRHEGGGAGLALYGFAAGTMWMLCRMVLGKLALEESGRGGGVYTVNPETWTRGTPKSVRRQEIAIRFPQYAQALRNGQKDTGGDVSDGIGLALWRWESGVTKGSSSCLTEKNQEKQTHGRSA